MGTIKNILIILSLLIANWLWANDLNYGLHFNSYDRLAKDRTSLILNDDESLQINNEWTIAFDLFIRQETVFGNVIRLVSNTGESISLNFSADDKNNRYPSLTVNDNFYALFNTATIKKKNLVFISLRIKCLQKKR